MAPSSLAQFPGGSVGQGQRVVVIGAGFGGIAAAVRMVQAGVEQLTILESRDGVGGVWRDNHYPDCACDIPAPLYSYSYAPNPNWSRRFPPRAEIAAYLDGVVDRFGLRPHLRLSTDATRASWNEATDTWTVELATGEELVCDVLITAVGQLSRPQLPAIDGIDSFAGPLVHSAQWPDGLATQGKRVAVVGTGASAIQIVPAIAPGAEHVSVFQRSAPWTLPKPDQRYGAAHRWLRRNVPATMKIGRGTTWAVTQAMGLAVTGNAPIAKLFKLISTMQRRFQVRDRSLLAKVTPDYEMGCKRVLFTSRWYPALRRANVAMVTERISSIEPDGLRTSDGTVHKADVLVFSTGFAATDLVAPLEVVGVGGTTLAKEWSSGAHAYLGITVPKFPNFFLVYGPNTNTGNTSVVYFHESQAGYIAQAVRLLRAQRGGAIEVREDVADHYDQEIQRRLNGSVWATCSSWYRHPSGRIVTNWPGMAAEYRRRTKRFDPADFMVTASVRTEV